MTHKHPCLLCRTSTTSVVRSLSGAQLRILWNAVGICLDDEAFGPIEPETAIVLYQCLNCGFRFFDPSLAGTESFYRQLKDEGYFALVRPEFLRALNFAKRRKLTNVLDVGCGTGAFLDLAKQAGLVTAGIELNGLAAEEARSKGHIILDKFLHQLDSGRQYDAVTLFQVLEHVPDPVQTMTYAARLLTGNGIISVAVPNARGLPALSWLQPQQWPPHHISHWRKRDFATLADSAGLRLISIESDVLFGRDLEHMWELQRRLAASVNRPSGAPPESVARILSLLYRKTGMKKVFWRVGSSIQAYFANDPSLAKRLGK